MVESIQFDVIEFVPGKAIESPDADDLPRLLRSAGIHRRTPERIWVLAVGDGNRATSIVELPQGPHGAPQRVADPVVGCALLVGTKRFAVAHNHLSDDGGSPTSPGRNENATSQARQSRRFGLIYLMWFLGSALVTGCASARTESAGAAPTPLGQVTNPPSPTASRPASQAFSSSLYGFEVALPSSWQTRRAIAAWASPELEDGCPLDWDCFSGTTDGRTLAVAAIEVSQETTLAAWQAKIHASAPSIVKDSDPPRETTLDGQRALKWTAVAASEGLNVIKLVALHGTRGYVLMFVSPMSTGLDADEAVFDAIKDTFRFTGR